MRSWSGSGLQGGGRGGQLQFSVPVPAMSVWPRLQAGISFGSSVEEGESRCVLALGQTGLWKCLLRLELGR